jgi:hypothetical protein
VELLLLLAVAAFSLYDLYVYFVERNYMKSSAICGFIIVLMWGLILFF